MFPKKGNSFPKDEGRLYADAISKALRAELGDGHRATKTVMRWTGASERSAKNWLNGTRAPTGQHLIRLAQESELVTRVFLTLAGRREFATFSDLRIARRALRNALLQIENVLGQSGDRSIPSIPRDS